MTINRRSFLKFAGLAGGAAAVGTLAAHAESIETLLVGGQYRVSQTRNALGTHVDITALGDSKYQTEDAVQAAFDDVMRMQDLLTRYDHKSPVCELNEEHKLASLSPELAQLFAVCARFHQDTQGAFDITVAPAIDLFKRCAQTHTYPTDQQIAEILPFIGAEKLAFDGKTLSIPAGMNVTFDGCAPGFIADRASDILAKNGIHDYLVNAGGEIRTAGHPKNADKWRIAIQDPAKQGNYPGFLAFNQGAVSTSGNYEIYYGEDKLFHHIVDAHTGRSPNALASVTVTAPTALQADILSTALFVMTPQNALRYVEAHPDFACLLIDRDGKQLASSRFVMA